VVTASFRGRKPVMMAIEKTMMPVAPIARKHDVAMEFVGKGSQREKRVTKLAMTEIPSMRMPASPTAASTAAVTAWWGLARVAMTAMRILPMLAMTADPRGVVMGWNRPTSSATMVIALTTMPVSVTALPPAVAMEFFAGI
jgi:hypothetical protein